MTTQIAPAPVRDRVHAVDTAKGIAILFVVFGHAWRGVFGAGLVADADTFHLVDRLIYAWHMPLFFFLSGLHYLSLITRHPPAPFVANRIIRLFWPLVIWTWLFFAFRLAAGAAANNPVNFEAFPLNPLPPYEHLWFLWALLLMQLLLLPFALFGRSLLGETAVRWILAGSAVLIAVCMALIFVPSVLFGPALAHVPYFLAGVAFARLSAPHPPLWVAISATALAGVLFYAVAVGGPQVPLSLALVLVIWVVFAALDPGNDAPSPILRLLRHLGHTSMAIYLAHTIFSAAFRIGLIKLDVTALPVLLIVTTAVGLIGPLVLLKVAERLRFKRVLGL